MSDYISLQTGQKESITLEYDQPYESEGQYGKQYTYGCEAVITGETKYTANPRVHGLIQKLGVGKGDTIIIEKVKGSPNDYITVGLPANHPIKQTEDTSGPPMHKSVEKFEKQFQTPDQKMENHELTLRVDSLEGIVAKLQQSCKKLMDDYDTKMSESGHKPGDEKLPV